MSVGVRPKPKRYGCEVPRIYTPPLRELTPDTSLGYSVIEFAEKVLEVELFPWQKWLLIHMLELREDGTFRFKTIVVLVARQNGKSTLSQVLALWAMFVLGIALVVGTAQDLDVAEEIWQGAVDLVDDIPELAEQKAFVSTTNGKKTLKLKSGERYKVKSARGTGAGRGLSSDLILLDELREHKNWDAWGAITKTTIARPNSQVLCLSNAGDAGSVVARYLRQMAHQAIGDPDGICEEAGLVEPDNEDLEQDEDTLGIFEWSAPPGLDKWDRDGWAQANPSLGWSITERSLAAACATDPDWVFRTECLCQWVDGTLEGPFPPGIWEKSGDDPTSSLPDGAPVVYGLDVSWNRSVAYITATGFRADGLVHLEMAAQRGGTEWVEGWFRERANVDDPIVVVLQAKGAPVSTFVDILSTIPGVEVVEWGGPDLGIGCGKFYDAVIQERLKHLPWSSLDVAAGTAVTKPAGDSWVWDRKKSPHDCAPIVSATAAVWHLLVREEELPDSAYEDHDLLIV